MQSLVLISMFPLIFISIFDGQFSDPPSHLSRAEWDVVGGQTKIVEECLQ